MEKKQKACRICMAFDEYNLAVNVCGFFETKRERNRWQEDFPVSGSTRCATGRT